MLVHIYNVSQIFADLGSGNRNIENPLNTDNQQGMEPVESDPAVLPPGPESVTSQVGIPLPPPPRLPSPQTLQNLQALEGKTMF